MARKPSALAGIFDDEGKVSASGPVEERAPTQGLARSASTAKAQQITGAPITPRRSSHPGKKAVLIHIPEDMHRTLRQLSVEEGGEPLTVVTERLLRQYLVQRGHTRFAP